MQQLCAYAAGGVHGAVLLFQRRDCALVHLRSARCHVMWCRQVAASSKLLRQVFVAWLCWLIGWYSWWRYLAAGSSLCVRAAVSPGRRRRTRPAVLCCDVM